MLPHSPCLRLRSRLVTAMGLLLCLAAAANGAPPWAQFLPFRTGSAPVRTASATRDVDYSLTERHGPWMIMCASFVDKADDLGTTTSGEAQAHALAHELRTKHRMQAFIFRQHFDFTQPEIGLGFNKYGGPRKMKPRSGEEFNEIAVMVGNFESVNDPALESTLKAIKVLKPACMAPAVDPKQAKQKTPVTTHLSTRVGEFYRNTFLPKNDERRLRGPLGRAFVTRNPLLPDEFFVAKGLDPFIVDMNKNLQYSLLRNPKRYSVKVATFRGVDTMKPKEFEELVTKRGNNSKIDEAAENASKLCAALRQKGIEAYEFHDTSESIVTIGSYDSVGEERPDGKTEINPAVFRVMEQYKAEPKQIPGLSGLAMAPKNLAGINFDAQPIPVEVPRQSLAANYNAGNGPLR